MPDTITRGEVWRSLRLCVDSYEHRELAGRFSHPGLEGGAAAFQSLTEFLLTVETMLDEAKFPQSFTAKRGFAPLSELRAEDAPEDGALKGKLATFSIRLMFRQHASWQGSVTWIEGNGAQSFRSVLELIILIDSALTGAGQGNNNGKGGGTA